MAKKLEYNTDYLFNYDVKESVNSVIDEVDGLIEYTNNLAINIENLSNVSTKLKPQSPVIFAPFGDSFSADSFSLFNWFALKSSGSIIIGGNYGIGGNTTAQMLARLSQIDDSIKMCTVLETANDASQGVSASQHAINMKAILEGLINKGITPILNLGSPKTNATHALLINQYNIYDWVTAKELGVLCLNPWVGMSNGLGEWGSGYSADGTHPTTLTYKLAGEKLWDNYNSNTLAFPLNNNNNYGLITNPLFINSTNGTTPNNWSTSGTITSTLTTTALGEGKTWNLNSSSFSFGKGDFTLVAGKRYIVAAKIKTVINSTDGSGKVDCYVQTASGSRKYLIQNGKDSIDSRLVSLEFVADQSGLASIYFVLNGTTFNIDLSIAQVTVFCVDDFIV